MPARLSFCLVTGLLFAVAAPLPCATAEEMTQEPPLRQRLRIGGTEVEIEPNKEISVDGKFENPKITLIPATVRTFAYAGIKFDYPAAYSWEADLEDPAVPNWTMQGNDCRIIVFAGAVKIDPKETLESTAASYKKMKATSVQSECTRNFGGKEISGLKLTVKMAGSLHFVQEAYSFKTGDGSHVLLLIQDTLDEAGKNTREMELAGKLLSKTFAIPMPEAVN